MKLVTTLALFLPSSFCSNAIFDAYSGRKTNQSAKDCTGGCLERVARIGAGMPRFIPLHHFFILSQIFPQGHTLSLILYPDINI